jgi:hypothetical protein
LLYQYCPNSKLYKCPTGFPGEVVTYAIVDAMNGYDAIPGAAAQIIKKRSKIRSARPRQLDNLVRPGKMVGPDYRQTRRRNKLFFCGWPL